MPRDNPSWTSYFDRFWIDFGSQLVTPEPTKSLKFYWFYKHFLLCGIFEIWSSFDSILVPTCFHFSSQNRPISLPESISKAIDVSIDFRIDFYTVLAATWIPFGPQVGVILAFRIGQEPPKKPPKTHPESPKTQQEKDLKMEPKNKWFLDSLVNLKCLFCQHKHVKELKLQSTRAKKLKLQSA